MHNMFQKFLVLILINGANCGFFDKISSWFSSSKSDNSTDVSEMSTNFEEMSTISADEDMWTGFEGEIDETLSTIVDEMSTNLVLNRKNIISIPNFCEIFCAFSKILLILNMIFCLINVLS